MSDRCHDISPPSTRNTVRKPSLHHHPHLILHCLSQFAIPSNIAYIILSSHAALYKPPSPRPPLSSLKSLAFWLRSSVVSVLHSLIAVTGLRTVNNDYSYFWNSLQNLWACSRSVAQCRSYLHYLELTRTIFFSLSAWFFDWVLKKKLQ